MSQLVHPDQACGVPKRSIKSTTNYTIQAIIEHAREHGGELVAVDLRKAYDLESHDWLFEVLEHMQFGEDLIRWIKMDQVREYGTGEWFPVRDI
jgi:hypothetical protein